MSANTAVAIPHPLQIASVPLWLEPLEAAVTRTEGDIPILAAGRSLTSEQVSHLKARAANLRLSLSKRSDGGDVAAQLFGLFASFPQANISDEMLKARMAAYIDVCSQYPLWAVADGIRKWMAGEDGSPHDNYAFPPSPPQLVRLVKLAMRPVYLAVHRYERMASARPDMPPPTAEQKARADALIASFTKPAA